MADTMEANRLDVAAELIVEAKHVLAELTWTPGELRLLAIQLTESLVDLHRVAESRGARLPAHAYDEADEVGTPGSRKPFNIPESAQADGLR